MFQLACVLACAFVFILLGILSFLDMKLIFFTGLGNFQPLLFTYFFYSILYSHCMDISVLNSILHFLVALFISFHFFLSILQVM